MDEILLKKILDDLYDHKIKPDGALWEITKLNNSNLICDNFESDAYSTSTTIYKNRGGEKYRH